MIANQTKGAEKTQFIEDQPTIKIPVGDDSVVVGPAVVGPVEVCPVVEVEK